MTKQPIETAEVYEGLDIEHLEGLALAGGWRVLERASANERSPHSIGYVVEDLNGRRGFLKVLDFDYYVIAADPIEAVLAATQAFHDERRLLLTAKKKGFRHVVRVLTSGVLRRSNGNPLPYLISELADSDARRQMDMGSRADDAWSARIAHNAAAGLQELHGADIAHQDVKPENVLCFPEQIAKLGDLGRAVDPHTRAAHMEHDIAGDEAFAPPELLYGYVDPNFVVRRAGCDLYLLGSLVISLLTGAAITPLVQSWLPVDHRASNWRGTSYADVLDSICHAFAQVMLQFDIMLAKRIPDKAVRVEIVGVVRQLCEPDPNRRGDPIARARGQNAYSLERFVTRLDLIAHKLTVIQRRKASA